MQESNFYTVIIPAFNEANHLPKCIEAIIDQSEGHKVEIIVANARSTTDDSKGVCADYPCQFIDTPHNSRAAQMNHVAQMAKGNIMLFVHADVLVPQEVFKHIDEALGSSKAYGWFSYRFDKQGFLRRINSFMTRYDGAYAGGGDQCIFITSSVFRALGGYNEDYCIMEDFELTRRIKNMEIPYKIIPVPATVSARKYVKHNYLKVNLVNLKALRMFGNGESPKIIKEMYRKALK